MSDNTPELADTLAADSGDATKGTPPPVSVRTGRQSLLSIGTCVGRYVLAERIGAGGMGNVYKARDPQLDRDIAVKLVATSDVAAAQEYLQREAQAMAKLSHPNVATVHDIGTWNDQLFIAMELCTGGSLATWLAEQHPWREVVTRFIAAGRGLAAAHEIGLVHRDFKPDNVLVGADGTVKVSDFGLVRSSVGGAATDSNGRPDGGRSGFDRIEGTPAYMAPEQLRGGDVDARSDQFAFAVSIWQGVCGGRPFQPEVGAGRDPIEGMLRAIESRRMMRSTTSKVPNRVIDILSRALSPEPAERWPSLSAMVDELERVVRPSRTKWYLLAAGAAVLTAVLALLVARWMRPDPEVPTEAGIETAALPMVMAVGDLAYKRALGSGDASAQVFSVARDPEDMEQAARAYNEALRITHDEELQPRIAHALITSGNCRDGLVALSAYLAHGGKHATTLHLNQVVFEAGKDKVQPLSMEDLAKLRAFCMSEVQVVSSEEDLVTLAEQYARIADFDREAQTYQKLYALTNKPKYLMSLASTLHSQGECTQAKVVYEQFIMEETRLTPEDIKGIRERAAQCKPSTDGE